MNTTVGKARMAARNSVIVRSVSGRCRRGACYEVATPAAGRADCSVKRGMVEPANDVRCGPARGDDRQLGSLPGEEEVIGWPPRRWMHPAARLDDGRATRSATGPPGGASAPGTGVLGFWSLTSGARE
ncbi:MAG: hypothetical protein AMXMBFR64_42260 [Myxococcales bacterium]